MKRKKLTAWLLTFVLLYPFLLFLAQGSKVHAASVTSEVYNDNGNTIYDVTGISAGDLLKWLLSHTDDNYYLGTPYGQMDNRNPLGDCAGKYGVDDTNGVAALNCTGFVWHALYKASGMSVREAFDRIPCMAHAGGGGGWASWIRANGIKHKTYYSDQGGSEDQLIQTVLNDDYIAPGDIIWTWDASTSRWQDGLSDELSDYHHVGIFMGDGWRHQVKDKANRWWHSSDRGIYGMDVAENRISVINPKVSCQAVTVVKMSESGKLAVEKTSGNLSITSGNSCYSLKGACYGVFLDQTCTEEITSAVTDGKGNIPAISLTAGTYYVREKKAPEGYMTDSRVYTVVIRPEVTETLKISEAPIFSTASIELYKKDKETGLAKAQGGASLCDAEFRFSFYKGHFKEGELPGQADQQWTAKTEEVTDENGDIHYMARLSENLPLGTLLIEEINPPVGYKKEGVVFKSMQGGQESPEKILISIRQDGEQAVVSGGCFYEVSEQVIRGDLEGVKIGEETHERLAGVTFEIKGMTGGEVFHVTTDDNGYFTTKTEENDKGTLPFDKYEITELPGEGNEGYKLIPPFTVNVSKDRQYIQLGTLTDKKPEETPPEDKPKKEEGTPKEEEDKPKEEKSEPTSPVVPREEKKAPRTGDNIPMRVLPLFILSCTALTYCAKIVKNNGRKGGNRYGNDNDPKNTGSACGS